MEKEKTFTKDEIGSQFNQSDKVKVVFEKKDGTIREMVCTRKMDIIPEGFRPGGNEEADKKMNNSPDHLFHVFDLEKNGWRSFTVAKVLSVTPL